jgi:hypothetical protein
MVRAHSRARLLADDPEALVFFEELIMSGRHRSNDRALADANQAESLGNQSPST